VEHFHFKFDDSIGASVLALCLRPYDTIPYGIFACTCAQKPKRWPTCARFTLTHSRLCYRLWTELYHNSAAYNE